MPDWRAADDVRREASSNSLLGTGHVDVVWSAVRTCSMRTALPVRIGTGFALSNKAFSLLALAQIGAGG